MEYIFQQYLSGASFNILVAQLREQPIPYDEGKLWNKNMVARILEDHRYTGRGGYPAITDQETLNRVLEKRSAKQAPAQKTEAQKLLRRLSGHTATKQMEQQVLNLLNGLIISSERITLPELEHLPPIPEQALQRELDTVMDQQPIDEDAAQKLILAIAAAQYSAINPDLKGNIRDYANVSQLVCLSNLENLNAVFIGEGMSQAERLSKLNAIAISQMEILTQDHRIEALEAHSGELSPME
ncbi:hypothetical protein B5F35_13275 [Anaeromassilibacillus sp. An200]|nr:hypothetical protein B5F35_13275 [Anaeromassilibacillus sp. An200]